MREGQVTKSQFEDLIKRVKKAVTEAERAAVAAEMEILTAEFEAHKGRYSGKVLENLHLLKRHIGTAAGCDERMGREKGQHTLWALEALGSLELELDRQ